MDSWRAPPLLNRRLSPRSLEPALRYFDLVTRLELYIQRRIFAQATHVVNGHVRAAEKANVFLVGKIVEPAGGVNRSEQGHVFSERDPSRRPNRAADIYESRRRLHHDRDVGIGVDFVCAIALLNVAGELRRSESFCEDFADVGKINGAIRINGIDVIQLRLLFGRNASDLQVQRITDPQRGLAKCGGSERENQQRYEIARHQYCPVSELPLAVLLVELVIVIG